MSARRLAPGSPGVKPGLALAHPGLACLGLGLVGLLLPLAAGAAVTRTYYLAAEEVRWDYTPGGKGEHQRDNPSDPPGAADTPAPQAFPGSRYRKAIFREYEDPGFERPKARAEGERHLGLLGPILHAEVGDTLRVVFRNNARRPYSLHPHGVLYRKDSEGAGYPDGTEAAAQGDDAVAPGASYTYTWEVPERAGPGPADPSSILWLYHSHVDATKDSFSGLVGGIAVTRRGMARPDGTPKDVDREVVTLFSVLDESQTWYLDESLREAAPREAGQKAPLALDRKHPAFVESNLRHAINGYTHGTLPGIAMGRCERVRWYVAGLGNEIDIHTAHWHGNVGLSRGSRRDVIDVLPAMTESLDMQPDNPGRWLLHCHVTDHLEAGMWALYTVTEDKDQGKDGKDGKDTSKKSPARPIGACR